MLDGANISSIEKVLFFTSLQFIQYHVAGFYKPTIPQSPPSQLWDYSTCNNARLEFSTIFVPSFDPNEWCLKNGLSSGGLNTVHLGHESSALTTRPRLLAHKQSLLSTLYKKGSHLVASIVYATQFQHDS